MSVVSFAAHVISMSAIETIEKRTK
jgi:hypothetical protein